MVNSWIAKAGTVILSAAKDLQFSEGVDKKLTADLSLRSG